MKRIPPTLAKAFVATKTAVIRAVNEHGAPNSFGISELKHLYGGYRNCGHAGMALRRWPEFLIVTKHQGTRRVRYNTDRLRLEVD